MAPPLDRGCWTPPAPQMAPPLDVRLLPDTDSVGQPFILLALGRCGQGNNDRPIIATAVLRHGYLDNQRTSVVRHC